MKYFLILFSVIFLSCKTDETKPPEAVEYKVWEITDIETKEGKYFPSIVEEGYILENIASKVTYLYLVMSSQESKRLESIWKKKYKKLRIDKITQIYLVSYNIEDTKLELNILQTDYVVSGENTKRVTESINSILKTQRANESPGAINLLYQRSHPDIIHQMKFPLFNDKNTFTFIKNDNEIKATDENGTIITLDYNGIHNWIGY